MSILPIVERELRVASRRRGTYWIRTGAALAFLLVWWALALGGGRGMRGDELGRNLFEGMSVVALGFCALAGVFLTADCLSQERREGTLGLLFLTRLKGRDVALGKLASSSLRGVGAVMAVLPLLGLPLLMGGVTAGELLRVMLVLGVTLLWSLSLGLAVSSMAMEGRQALLGTLACVLVLGGGLPSVWWIQEIFLRSSFDGLRLMSPVDAYRLSMASWVSLPGGWGRYWTSVFCIAAVAAVSLGVACARLSAGAGWREGHGGFRIGGSGRWRRERKGAGVVLGLRRRVPEGNPFLWLARRGLARDRALRKVLLLLGLVWGVFFLAALISSRAIPAFVGAMLTGYVIHQVLKVMVVVDAGRRFNEDARSGALELLLVSPLKPRSMIEGQRRALREEYFRPIQWVLAVNWLMLLATWLDPTQLRMSGQDQEIFTILFLGGAAVLVTDYWALSRTGMAEALSRRPQGQVLVRSLAWVMGIPWLLLFFIVFGGIGGVIQGDSLFWLFSFWFVCGMVVDLVMGARAERVLRRRVREVAGSGVGRIWFGSGEGVRA